MLYLYKNIIKKKTMKNIIRLTESDLHRIIKSSVSRILKEEADTQLLSQIVQGIMQLRSIDASPSRENDVDEIQLQNGNLVFISFNVNDRRYLVQGMRSGSYDVPDDPDEIEGDYDIDITSIEIYSEDGEKIADIEDNGMVADAIKSIADVDNSELEYYEDDFYDE